MIKIGRNDPCWCGSGQKYKKCHFEFDERLEDLKCSGYKIPPHKIIKTPEQIEGIKASARINIAVLDYVAEHIKAGISTEEINGWVDSVTREMGGIRHLLIMKDSLRAYALPSMMKYATESLQMI